MDPGVSWPGRFPGGVTIRGRYGPSRGPSPVGIEIAECPSGDIAGVGDWIRASGAGSAARPPSLVGDQPPLVM